MVEDTQFNTNTQPYALTGKALLDREREIEDATTALIEYLLDSNQMGVYAPLIYEQLGNSLSLLVQMASCAWGCRGGEHDIENILRRFCNSAFAALRLLNSGLYDEALNHARGMAEIANLLQVFCLSKNSLEEWKKSSSRERMKKFSPVKVRLAIEAHEKQPVVDEAVYSKLCEIGIHISPSSLYLSYEFNGIHHIGAHFTVQGVLLTLNTLSRLVAPCLLFAGVLTKVSNEKTQVLEDAFHALSEVIRGISVTNYQEFFIKQQADRVRDSLNREIPERLARIQELGKATYRELIEAGVLNEDDMNEEEIKEKVLDRTMEKVLEEIRNQLGQEDLQWVDEGMQFAVKWQFERKLKQYYQRKQTIDNQIGSQPLD